MIKPIWSYGIQIWVRLAIQISKSLRYFNQNPELCLVGALWFVSSKVTRWDHNMRTDREDKNLPRKYSNCLEDHPNLLSIYLLFYYIIFWINIKYPRRNWNGRWSGGTYKGKTTTAKQSSEELWMADRQTTFEHRAQIPGLQNYRQID